MKGSAKVFVVIIVLAGLAVLFSAPFHSDGLSPQWGRFAAFLILTMIAAGMHVRLPRITGSMSVNLPFILLAVTQLSLFEALIVACSSAVVQCLSMRKRVELSKVAFNLCNMANAVGVAHSIYNVSVPDSGFGEQILLLAGAAAAYFFLNTAPGAIVIALTEGKNAARTWGGLFLLTYPYYLLSAGMAAGALAISSNPMWELPVVTMPLVYGVYCSYKRYFARQLEAESAANMITVAGR
jgi:hypothetical protein